MKFHVIVPVSESCPSGRIVKTNKTNLLKSIQTLFDEGFEQVQVTRISPPKHSGKIKSFRPGDTVRVIANTSGHEFELGSIVTVIDSNSGKCADGIDYWFLSEDDIEHV